MGAVSCFVVQSTSPVHWSSPVIDDRHLFDILDPINYVMGKSYGSMNINEPRQH